jgi:hypothetical protein
MLEDRERLKQECVQAASIHYGLQEAGRVYPVVRELPLERDERADWTFKFALLVAGRPALVYRNWDGAYKVADDPDRQLTTDEQAEKEAYQAVVTAARYLECDLCRVGRLEVQNLTHLRAEEAPCSASWRVWLDMESCIVDRYDEPGAPAMLSADRQSYDLWRRVTSERKGER